MKKFLFLLLTCLSFFKISAQDTAGKDVIGVWASENGKQQIEVYYDNQKGKYFGRVLWMAEDDPSLGTSLIDVKNPDPSLRNRRMTGANLLYDFYYGGNNYFYGYIYDPVSGSSYKSRMHLEDDHKTATIRGYVMLPMFGRSEKCTKIR